MKKTLLTLSIILGLPIIVWAAVFNSGQVGTTPSNGYVLQTNGSVSTWVATSSLGLVPYTGATVDLNLGTHNFTNTGTTTTGGLSVNGNQFLTGVLKSGTSSASLSMNGLGSNGMDINYVNGGIFRATETTVAGPNDVFFQGLPSTSSGYTYLEGYTGAGLVIGTGGGTTPVIFKVNRTEVGRFGTNGYFGINTPSPTARLNVTGNSIITGTSTFGDTLTINKGYGGGTGFSYVAGAGNPYQLNLSAYVVAPFNVGYTWSVFNNGVTTNALNITGTGNVGIGTTSPSNRLEVSGNTFLGGNLTATGTLAVTATTTTGGLKLTNLASTVLAVDSLGNVIATTTSGGGGGTPSGASSTIQFNANGAFGGDSNLTWDGSLLNINGTASSTRYNFSKRGYLTQSSFGFNYYDPNGTTAFTANGSSGNGLFIIGDYSTGHAAIISGDSVSSPSYSWVSDFRTGIYHPTTYQIGVSTNGSEIARFTTTGLGIGTTTPSASLDVYGTVKLEGTSTLVTASISGAIVGLGCDSADTTGLTGISSTTAFITTPQTYPGDGLNWFTYALSTTSIRTKVCSDVTVTPVASTYNVKIIQ